MSQLLIEALVIMAIGTIGSFVPLLPGPPIVWLGALYYGWRTEWAEIGLPSLSVLLVLAIIGGTADLWMGYLGASKGGASLRATVASIIGGIIGLLIASLPGAIIGSIGAIALVEWPRHRDWRKVARASGGYLIGSLLSSVVEICICLLMIGIFLIALYI